MTSSRSNLVSIQRSIHPGVFLEIVDQARAGAPVMRLSTALLPAPPTRAELLAH